MSYRKEDFSNMLFGQLAFEGHLTYLNELDPTHIIKQRNSLRVINVSQTPREWRAPLPSCVLTHVSAAPVLLELDPTHSPIR